MVHNGNRLLNVGDENFINEMREYNSICPTTYRTINICSIYNNLNELFFEDNKRSFCSNIDSKSLNNTYLNRGPT